MHTPRRLLRRARFSWNPTARYHAWLLRNVPRDASSALDVGSGDGSFARQLAATGLEVDAVERHPPLVERARRGPAVVGLRWLAGDVLDPALPLRQGGYDVVVALGSLHQMPLDEGLERLRSLVRPDGRLLVIGLHRAESAWDTTLSAVALPAHLLIGSWRRHRGLDAARYDPSVPLSAPRESLAEIRAAVRRHLPGARVRRRLLWRYTLSWRP